MNIERLREFEQIADDRASAVCFDNAGNAVPDMNWHDQFLIGFSKLIIAHTKEACAKVCDCAIGAEGIIGDECYQRQLAAKDAEIERLKQALEDYGDHSEKCKRKGVACFCGFDAARGEVK